MASVVKSDGESKSFPKDPLDKKLILSSMRDFAPDGLILGVEKMGNPINSGYGVQAFVQLTILDEMPKCRKYVLDEEGQYIKIKDELTGEENNKVEIGDGHLETIGIFYKLGSDEKEPDDETECKLNKFSSSYPLFVSALIENGDLPDDAYGETISTTPSELKEALEGYEFTAKVGSRSYKGRKYEFIVPIRE